MAQKTYHICFQSHVFRSIRRQISRRENVDRSLSSFPGDSWSYLLRMKKLLVREAAKQGWSKIQHLAAVYVE